MKQFRIQLVLIWLSLSTSICFAQNPLNFGSNIRTADPSAHVWEDGKIYLYTSHDEECQEDFWMKDWHVFSSGDLVNWTDHGPCLSVDDLSWADNYAWAPDCAYKNGKYYFCFPAGTGIKDRKNPENSTKWMGIGIAVSDAPTGPFTDAIGGPLWTEPYANDPCLFIDDDGKAYMYFHGGDDYLVAEMADDLLSIKGDFFKMDMGGYEPKMEGPWVFKRNGIYYFTMPENNRVLTYYMSDSPKGPWKYKGEIMESENESNNHHSIVEFNGQWILFYHRWLDIDSDCGRQRHTCAEYLYFNDDGTIQEVVRTDKGLAGRVEPAMPQLEPVRSGVYKWADHPVKKKESGESRKILEGVSPHFEYLEIYAATQFPGAKPSQAHANDDIEECIIVKEGKMKATIEGRSEILGAGGVILLMPRQMYALENVGDGNLTYYVMRYRSKKKMDLERGQAAGGPLMLNKDSLTFKRSARGGGIAYFDRPTAMCERFEMHITRLNAKGPSHQPHTHEETEIILVLSGETEMTIDGKEYKGKAGDFYFMESQLLHGVRNATDEPCTYFAFKWK